MIEVVIPGHPGLRLSHIVLDYNGTMAMDGTLVSGVCERLNELAEKLEIHILTADTFGKVRDEAAAIRCDLTVLPSGSQDSHSGALLYRGRPLASPPSTA